MARKPRIYFPGALYHVIARGNQGQTVFHEDRDFTLYRQFLVDYKVQFRFSVYAYALMPNHIHLLLETGQTSLSRIMHRLQFHYTLRTNLKYKTHGHLFQGRYKSILCDKDTYLLELSAYIHLNPVRAGLVKDPSDYPGAATVPISSLIQRISWTHYIFSVSSHRNVRSSEKQVQTFR